MSLYLKIRDWYSLNSDSTLMNLTDEVGKNQGGERKLLKELNRAVDFSNLIKYNSHQVEPFRQSIN